MVIGVAPKDARMTLAPLPLNAAKNRVRKLEILPRRVRFRPKRRRRFPFA
jgi:hypothetical protein